MIDVVGLGGGCHWCTEGVFQSLIGIEKVNQGWIAPLQSHPAKTQSNQTHFDYSEAIEVYFDPQKIDLATLIEIHLYTHASSSNHSMRSKYRSAIYTYNQPQTEQAQQILNSLQKNFDKPLVTRVYPFASFKPNKEEYVNYFYQDPDKPFCQSYIHPKLKLLLTRFSQHTDKHKLEKYGFKL